MRNKVQLIGNAGNAPEVKTTPTGKKVATLSIATNEVYTNKIGEQVKDTQWHRITAWNGTAEIIENYVKKGSHVAIEGKLNHRNYEDSNGNTQYVTEIIVDKVHLLDRKALA